MTDPKQVAGDLAYVRAKVRQAEGPDAPALIYFMWAAIAFVGFALVDVAAEYVRWFWMIVGPLGGLASFALGRRHAIGRGAISKDEALRHALHWGGLFAAIIVTLPLLISGRIAPETFTQIVLLLIAIAYFYAGVHLDRYLLWVAIALTAGFLAVGFVEGPIWTVVGTLVGLSLVIVGFTRARAARAHAD